MCEHCGCEQFGPIRELHSDHIQLLGWIDRIISALAANDLPAAEHLRLLMAALLERHDRFEEAGIYPQIAKVAPEYAVILDRGHHKIRQGMTSPLVTAADGERLKATLDILQRHIFMEEQDLFPYAMQMLGNDEWDQIELAHRRLTPAHAVA